jgi:hypothetical protein
LLVDGPHLHPTPPVAQQVGRDLEHVAVGRDASMAEPRSATRISTSCVMSSASEWFRIRRRKKAISAGRKRWLMAVATASVWGCKD